MKSHQSTGNAIDAITPAKDQSNTGTPARSSFDGKLQKEQSTRKTIKTGDIPSSPSISMFGKLMQRSQSAIATKSFNHPEAANGSDSAASPRKKKSMSTAPDASRLRLAMRCPRSRWSPDRSRAWLPSQTCCVGHSE